MAKVTGADRHSRRLKRARDVDVVSALYAAGQMIEIDAERSITEGSVSGKNHIPSKPGEPPNADTRLLDLSIETTIESRDEPKVHVTSNAPYSAALEFGTSKMIERPFMRPATKRNRNKAAELVSKAVSISIKT